MKTIAVFFTVSILFAVADAQAQQKNPCSDSLYLRLKAVPRVSLTQSERKYIDQKEQECAEFKAGAAKSTETNPIEAKPRLAPPSNPAAVEQKDDPPKAIAPRLEEPAPVDSLQLKQESREEPLLSGRNIGIFAVIFAAIVGLAVALGGVTPAPF